MGLRLDWIFDRADEDGVFDDGDDDAAGREVYDDFLGGHILNLLGGGWRRKKMKQSNCREQKYRCGIAVAVANACGKAHP